jgi:hypothetical protein
MPEKMEPMIAVYKSIGIGWLRILMLGYFTA